MLLKQISFSVTILVLIFLVVSIFLLQIPLLNYLGYEFSAVVSILIYFVVGLGTISSFRKYVSGKEIQQENLSEFYLRFVKRFSLFLIIPLICATLNMLFVKNCGYFEGLAFYILIPVITFLFSISLAMWCVVMFRQAIFVYILFYIIFAAYSIFTFYFNPQDYFYNIVIGYFPGLSYDEVLTITPSLLYYRILTLFAAILVFLSAKFIIKYSSFVDTFWIKLFNYLNLLKFKSLSIWIILLCGLLILGWIFREELGFEHSRNFIQMQLGGKIKSEHFHIYYDTSAFTEDEIEYLALEHEFQYRQIVRKLDVTCDNIIESYIYTDEDSKRKLVGAGGSDNAKPWLCQIHMSKNYWENTIKHELVHVLAAEFGSFPFRTSWNLGLVEGLAMAVEWDFGNLTLHEYAAVINESGRQKSISDIMTFFGFVDKPSTMSYVLAGSFCRFLIDEYGIERFKEFYSGKTSSFVYGKDIAGLEKNWLKFISVIEVKPEWEKQTEFYFKRKTIFAKECARTLARLNREGKRAYNENRFSNARQIYSNSLLRSWNNAAFTGLIKSHYYLGEYDSVVNMMKDVASDSIRRSSIQNLLIIYGDALWALDSINSANIIFKEAKEFSPSENFAEAAVIRLEILADDFLRKNLKSFLISSNPAIMNDSIKVIILDELLKKSQNSLIHYLKGRVLISQKQYLQANYELNNLVLNNKILDFNREKLLGINYFLMKQYEKAKIHFWQALNYTHDQASINRIYVWLERCGWDNEF